jgi:hypothetical protein
MFLEVVNSPQAIPVRMIHNVIQETVIGGSVERESPPPQDLLDFTTDI